MRPGIALVFLCALVVSCIKMANFSELMDMEEKAFGSGDSGVTIMSPAQDEYLQTVKKNSDGTLVDNPLVLAGKAVYETTGEDIDDDMAYVWTSNIDGVLGVGKSFTLGAPLSPGTHTITLTVRDTILTRDASVQIHMPHVFIEEFRDSSCADLAETTARWNSQLGEAHLGPYLKLRAVKDYYLSYNVNDIRFIDRYLYVAYLGTLGIYDISDPGNPVYQRELVISTESVITSFILNPAYGSGYVTCGKYIFRLNIADPSNPVISDCRLLPQYANDVAQIDEDEIHIATTGGLYTLWYYTWPPTLLQTSYSFPASDDHLLLDNVHGVQYVAENLPNGYGWYSWITAATIGGEYKSYSAGSFTKRIDALAYRGNVLYAAMGTSGIKSFRLENDQLANINSIRTVGYSDGLAVAGNNLLSNEYLSFNVYNIAEPGNVFLAGTHSDPSYRFDGKNAVSYGNYFYIPFTLPNSIGYPAPYGFKILSQEEPMERISGLSLSGEQVLDIALYGTFSLCAAVGGGLGMYDLADAQNPLKLSTIANGEIVNSVTVSGDYAYVANMTSHSVDVYGMLDPRLPVRVGTYASSEWNPVHVRSQGNFIYCLDDADTLHVLSIADPLSPVHVGSVAIGAVGRGMCVSGSLLLVACDTGLRIVDVSLPSSPFLRGFLPTIAAVNDVAASNGFAYLAVASSELLIADITAPNNPVQRGTCALSAVPLRISFSDGLSYLALGTAGVYAIDCTNPAQPVVKSSCVLPNDANVVAVFGNYILAAIDGRNNGNPICQLSVLGKPDHHSRLFNDQDQQIVQSTSFANRPASRVRLTANVSKGYGTSLFFEMSNNSNPNGWEVVNEGVVSSFVRSPEGIVKWRARLQSGNKYETPRIREVRVEYWE